MSLTPYYTATTLDASSRLRLEEVGRNGDFAAARYSIAPVTAV